MNDKPNGATPLESSSSILDKNTIAQIAKIFNPKRDKRLIWDPIKPWIKNSKGQLVKNNYWDPSSIDWAAHLSGKLKQGAQLGNEGRSRALVVDIDIPKGGSKVPAEKICKDAWLLDNKLVPFMSPSKNWHVWKFYPKDQLLKDIAKEAMTLGQQFKKLGYEVDFGKTLPKENDSQLGINLPFHSHQMPHSPVGKPLTIKQFFHRLKFQKHPLIAAAAGMQEPGRHTALVKIAAYLEKLGSIDSLDSVIENFGDPFDDDKYISRIKDNKIHEKYKDISNKGISSAITEIVGFDYEITENNHVAMELHPHTGLEKLKPRPWIIKGWLMKKTLTLLVGQPGIGKTMLLHMFAWALCNGLKLLGKTVLERGNVLIVCAEETINEIDLRLVAISKILGKSDGKFKIYRRGLEEDLKLVKFGLTTSEATKQYWQLKKSLEKYNVKYIILDPLINFQTGNYDENSNHKMEEYIKNFLIPLAIKADGCVITGHHTNKLSMVSVVDKELLVDHQNAMFSARGASSLIAAARFVLGMQPMTRQLWEKYFKEHINDGSNFVHYTGMIEAKSNYNVVEDDIAWLKKETVSVDVEDNKTEDMGVFITTELNKLTKAKNKLKAEQNEVWARSHIPLIKRMMDDAGKDSISLHSVVTELVPQDERYGNTDYPEATIATDVRRRLQNGLAGKVIEPKKGGLTAQGISFDDGYNYWVKIDHAAKGNTKVFIERGKDFNR